MVPRRTNYIVPTYRGFNTTGAPVSEWKYKDTVYNATYLTAAQNTLLDGLAPGSDATQRIGRQVTVRSLQFNIYTYATSTATTDVGPGCCRTVIFFDRQANGTAPSAADVLEGGAFNSPRSMNNRKRFKIIYDELRGMGNSNNSNNPMIQRGYIKFRRPVIVTYNSGTAGTIGDIMTNSLFILTMGTAITAGFVMTGNTYARIRYSD